MPDKIQSLNDSSTAQSLFDLLFPREMRQQAGLTDAEAGVLYTMWKTAPRGTTSFASSGYDNNLLSGLKSKGYLAGMGGALELTDKGKKIIVEMVTHEPNAFEKKGKEVSYNQIRAKKSDRPRQAFKKASKDDDKVFNLRIESIRRMSE